MSVPPLLLGRDAEVEQLVLAFDRCRVGRRGHVVVVHGPTGAGVSAVVQSLRSELARRGLPHDWWAGECTRGADIAYEAIAALLRDAPGGAQAWLDEAASVASVLGDAASVAMLTGLARRVSDAARDSPLVLAIDGVDAADASTLRLLGALPNLLADAPVLVVLAGRTGGAGEPPCSSIVQVDGVSEMALGPLPPDAIADIVRAASAGVGTAFDDQRVAAIVTIAAGRPALAAQLATVSDPLLPLGSVLDTCGSDAAALVAAVELAGGTVTLDAVRVALGATRRAVAAVAARGVLEPHQVADRPGPAVTGGWWAEAARSALGAAGVATVAAAIAPLVEGSGVPGAWRYAAAAWAAAGEPARASAAHERASAEALAAHALATAGDELRQAIRVGGADRLDALGQRAAELSLGGGDWEEADRLASAVLPRLARDRVDERVSLFVVQYRARFFAGVGDADDALDAALAEPPAGSAARADALVLDAFRMVLDDPASAIARAVEAMAIGDALADEAVRATSLGALGLAEAVRGDADRSERAFDDALRAADASGDPVVAARVAGNHVYALWRAGRPLDVERRARHELDRLDAAGVPWLGDQLALSRAVALFTLGRLGEVPAAIDRARATAVTADARALLDLLDAEHAILRGELDRAEASIASVGAMTCADDPTIVSELAMCRAALADARGDAVGALDLVRVGLASVGAEDDLARARLAVVGLRAAQQAGVAFDEVAAPHPKGAEVAALVAEFEALRDGSDAAWARAQVAWDAVPGPVGAWRCRLDAALRAGEVDAIAELAAQARAMGADGLAARADVAWRAAGGRRPPRRVEGPLTERELEVLELVARGFTNRAVGEALAISHRTVAVHVDRCLTKLGASNRSGAVHEARRLGLLP